jgi:hypothetical protein
VDRGQQMKFKLTEIIAIIFTILFVMGLGTSAYHQHEVLTRRKPRYEYIQVPLEEHTQDSQEVIIEGYAILP